MTGWLVLLMGLISAPGLCQGVQVLQKKLLLVPLGHPAEIPCYQDQSTHLNMYWYQQNPGEGLKLMVYSSDAKEETMEKDYGGRWSLNRSDIYNSALKLKEAKMEDEG
ncbi:T cell receptor beta variable 10-3, partial [Xenopus tropicalis]|uniref:T cell receptor beta variable 10-3 n=1 Tax=Xenopus tropicalis TaxID=8364 RepID=UPI0012F676EA